MQKAFSLLAGWLVDGTGSPAIGNVLLRIENGAISSMEPIPPGRFPELSGSEHGDFSGCTIIPALVDSHVHLTLSGTADQQLRSDQLHYTYEQKAPLIGKRIAKYLSYGILALRDGGDRSADTLRYKMEHLPQRNELFSGYVTDTGLRGAGEALSDRAGFVQLKTPGSAWKAIGRYGAMIGNPPEPGLTLAESIQRGTDPIDHVKIINSGLNSLTEFGQQTLPQFSREELEFAINTASQRGLKIMVHANGTVPVGDAIMAGCSSIEHGFFMGIENMRRMADAGIPWIPTAFSMKALHLHTSVTAVESQIAARNLDHQLQQISRAHSLGVPVALGTDAGGFGLHHAESFLEEFKIFRAAGFTVEQAVRCSTLEGARILGLEKEIGSIRIGMPATFVILDGPPARIPDSLRSVRTVYVGGRIVYPA